MEIKILGARANIANAAIIAEGYRLHAGVLIDDKILLDVGETQFLDHQPLATFITHMHDDHAYFVRTHSHAPANVYGPSSDYGVQALHKSIAVADYQVTPVPTAHTARLPSQGYLVARAGKRIFYTGDLVSMSPAALASLPRLDAVIAEASFIRRGGMARSDPVTGQPSGHCGIPDIIDMFQSHTNKIIFMHFGSWFVRDPIAGTAELCKLERPGLRLIITCDGMTVRI